MRWDCILIKAEVYLAKSGSVVEIYVITRISARIGLITRLGGGHCESGCGALRNPPRQQYGASD